MNRAGIRTNIKAMPKHKTLFILVQCIQLFASPSSVQSENQIMSQKVSPMESRVSSTIRQIRKPLMEKKRRARINESMETLKEILLNNSVAITQGSRPTKLEKADILEMTVRYLDVLHQRLATKTSPHSLSPAQPILLSTNKSPKIAQLNGIFSDRTRTKANQESDKENVVPTSTTHDRRIEKRHNVDRAFQIVNKEKNGTKNMNLYCDDSNPWRPW